MPKIGRIQLGSALEICISKSIINQKWYFISHTFLHLGIADVHMGLEFEAQNGWYTNLCLQIA